MADRNDSFNVGGRGRIEAAKPLQFSLPETPLMIVIPNPVFHGMRNLYLVVIGNYKVLLFSFSHSILLIYLNQNSLCDLGNKAVDSG